MSILKWMMYIMNIIGLSLVLMIPIFNVWYLGELLEENMFKECKEYWDEDSQSHGDTK